MELEAVDFLDVAFVEADEFFRLLVAEAFFGEVDVGGGEHHLDVGIAVAQGDECGGVEVVGVVV